MKLILNSRTLAVLLALTVFAPLGQAAPKTIPATKKPVARTSVDRVPAGLDAAVTAGGGSTRDIGKELRVTGQSRALSMGLMFQKDKNKLAFGTPRTSYRDKIAGRATDF